MVATADIITVGLIKKKIHKVTYKKTNSGKYHQHNQVVIHYAQQKMYTQPPILFLQNTTWIKRTKKYASQLSTVVTQTTPELEMTDCNTGKRQAEDETSQPSKKSTPNGKKGTPLQHPSLQDLWLGFQHMELLATDLNGEPYTHTHTP